MKTEIKSQNQIWTIEYYVKDTSDSNYNNNINPTLFKKVEELSRSIIEPLINGFIPDFGYPEYQISFKLKWGLTGKIVSVNPNYTKKMFAVWVKDK